MWVKQAPDMYVSRVTEMPKTAQWQASYVLIFKNLSSHVYNTMYNDVSMISSTGTPYATIIILSHIDNE